MSNYTHSKHNIMAPLRDSDHYFVVNPLSKEADILDEKEYDSLLSGTADQSFIDKGYLVREDEEAAKYRAAYLDHLDRRETDDVQLFFLPRYDCNFDCSYCFQSEYEYSEQKLTPEVIDSFFGFIDKQFKDKTVYITLFGGEPLYPGKEAMANVEYLVHQANQRSIDIAVVTNGYYLKEYLPILETAVVREIQLTLDGLESTHNKRRPLKGDAPTFKNVVAAVDATLDAGIPVNLRMVVDRENIDNLPGLASFAIEKGWTNNPLFKTQLGRNYELHFCQDSSQLLSRIEIYELLYNMIGENPHILQFHKPGFSISKFLFEQGDLPEPLFDSCPACKTEWAFDYAGDIYPCTATVGAANEKLGTYYPEVQLNEDRVELWEERDVTSIDKCSSCNLRLACGGGCGSVAKNESGKIQSPDCRPIKDLLSMGITLYKNKEETNVQEDQRNCCG